MATDIRRSNSTTTEDAGNKCFVPEVIELCEAGADEPYRWKMSKTLTWIGVFGGEECQGCVPEAATPFETDLASVPRSLTWLVPRYGKYTKAAVLHDYLCQTFHEAHQLQPDCPRPSDSAPGQPRRLLLRDRSDADEVFRSAMKQLEVPWLRRWLMWSAVSWATIVSSIYPGPSKPTVRTWLARLILGVPALALLLALLTLGPGPLLRPLWPHGQILRLLTIAAGVGVAALWVMVAGVVALGRADRLSTYLVAVLITAVASPLLAAGAAISLLFLLYVVVEEIATGCNGLRKWHDLYDESPRAKRIAAIRNSH